MSEILKDIFEEAKDILDDSSVEPIKTLLWRAFDLGARSGGVSERALIEARREGYTAALLNTSVVSPDAAYRLAVREYPPPKVTRPLRVTLSSSRTWSYAPRNPGDEYPFVDHVPIESDVGGGRASLQVMSSDVRTAADFTALARILSGETEEVEADV